MISIENPTLVDVNGGNTTTIVVNDENIVITVTAEGIILDFWHDDSDADAADTMCMTFDEWRDHARR